MALPLGYSLRNLMVRRASTLFTAAGIAMTVAVFAGVLSLRNGFEQLYQVRGRQDIVVYLRPGANSEGDSAFGRESAQILKVRDEIARDGNGAPLAAAETFLAVYKELVTGGTTNVPLRGLQKEPSLALREGQVELVEGRWFESGADEVVVGEPLTERMLGCRLGDTIELNMSPFVVVGVFRSSTAEGGEIWGDAERMMSALDRPVFQRIVARVKPGTDVEAIRVELESDARTPAVVYTEQEYMARQTGMTGGMLQFLAFFLTAIMGVAAVLGSMNTMLAAVSARTHEVGVLLAIGYRRSSIFFAFVFEAGLIGLLGGGLGLLIALPFDGTQTGLANWNTFTDVSFEFRLTPELALTSFVLAFVLGLVGGTLPALRAAMLKPVEAFRAL